MLSGFLRGGGVQALRGGGPGGRGRSGGDCKQGAMRVGHLQSFLRVSFPVCLFVAAVALLVTEF